MGNESWPYLKLHNVQESCTTSDPSIASSSQTDCETAKNEPGKSVNAVKFCISGDNNGLRHLKNAARDIERSSSGVLDEANIDRSKAGVTGIRLFSGGATCGVLGAGFAVDDVDADEDMWNEVRRQVAGP
uniref:Uncharacterized protein n=1 Tax=Moniliophthora roreri TaxID=221103 RepID=A0A0W0EZQ8_MONRR